jgi:hypothetical protein
MIKTPFVEKTGYLPPETPDADVIEKIDSLVYSLNYYKQRIIEKEKDKASDDEHTDPKV